MLGLDTLADDPWPWDVLIQTLYSPQSRLVGHYALELEVHWQY